MAGLRVRVLAYLSRYLRTIKREGGVDRIDGQEVVCERAVKSVNKQTNASVEGNDRWCEIQRADGRADSQSSDSYLLR